MGGVGSPPNPKQLVVTTILANAIKHKPILFAISFESFLDFIVTLLPFQVSIVIFEVKLLGIHSLNNLNPL